MSVNSPTIRDVAARAGVSRAAVSKVLRDAYGVSPAMRARVEAAMEELHYRPRIAARTLRGRSHTIGVALPDIHNPFFLQVLSGLNASLAGHALRPVICADTPESPTSSTINDLVDRQVEALVLLSPRVDADRLAELARTTPVVVIGPHSAPPGCDVVCGDDAAGTRLAMARLLPGRHRIVHLTGTYVDPQTFPDEPHSVRLSTYVAEMQRAGLTPSVVHVGEGPRLHEDVSALLESRETPEAIFASHDELALDVLWAMTTGARTVPLIGYDGLAMTAHPRLSLTTIDQRGDIMGRRAGQMVLERLGGREVESQFVVSPELRARSSG